MHALDISNNIYYLQNNNEMKDNIGYAFYTENFEIYQFKFKTYGNGVYYDRKVESYDAAIERAKAELYAKVEKDNPHLYRVEEPKVVQANNKSAAVKLSSGVIEILNAKDKDELASFELIAQHNPEMLKAYQQRLSELDADKQNKKTLKQ